MTRVENTIASFCNGDQSLDELLATIEHLIKHDGIKPEFILSALNKEKYKASLTPNVIGAIKRRLHPVPYTIDSHHTQLTEEYDDTIDYDDTQKEIDALNEPPSQGKKKASSFHQEHDIPSSSSMHGGIADTEMELVGLALNERYELVTYLGSGGMGAVYKAIDRKQLKAGFNNPNVAIKILHRALGTNGDGLQSLQQEVNHCQELNHPNIVEVYGANQDGAITYLVMEYLCGQSLKHKIAAVGIPGLPIGDALPIILAMGKALAFAHENGVVHYDFKPSNVIITEDEQIKVIDFGIAKAISKSKEDEGALAAANAITPTYASPEMLERRPPDPRDDIFAFACTTYELLTGRHPFRRKRATEARTMGLLPEKPQELSPTQWRSLQQALEFDRSKRTNNLTTLIEDMTYHEAPWPSSSGFIRGIAASIVIGISVTGLNLGNTRQNLAGFLDSTTDASQPFETQIAQAPSENVSAPRFGETEPNSPAAAALSARSTSLQPELKTQHEHATQPAMQHRPTPDDNTTGGHNIPKTANDSADFASMYERTQQADTANDSGAQPHASIPTSTPNTVAPPSSTDLTNGRRKGNYQSDEVPGPAWVSTGSSSATPANRENTRAKLSVGIGDTTAPGFEISDPSGETPQTLDSFQAKNEKRDKQAATLATLNSESLISRMKRSDHYRIQSIPELPASSSLFLSSISEGNARAVQDALNSGVSTDTRIPSSGVNALMLAASKGHTEIVGSLLRAEADINARDIQGWTALFWAASKGHVRVIKQLLDYGAMASLRDKNGETALTQATWAGHDAVVQALVNKGVEMNMRDEQGLTALTVAAINGHTPIVKTLLNAGADPNLGTYDGKTALMAAAWNGHADVVRILSEGDCLLDITSADGWTALMNAAWSGHATIVRDLVKAGANPFIKNDNQMSAMHAAETQGFRDIADFLNKIGEK